METKRKPRRSRLGGMRNILNVEAPPGKVYRWVNDVSDRVSRMVEDGWSVVTKKDTQVGDRAAINNNQSIGTGARRDMGGGITGVLMELDKEEYDLRMEEYNKEAAKPINEIKRRKHGGEGNYGKVEVI